MSMAQRLPQFLNRKGIEYRVLHHARAESLPMAAAAAGVPESQVVQATLLIDGKGVVMAVHPLQARLDLEALGQLLKRRLQLLTPAQADRLFADCEAGMHPPFASAWGISAVVDERVMEMPRVVVTSGTRNAMLQLDGRAFRLAMAGTARGRFVIAETDESLESAADMSLDQVARKLQKLYRLPPMPAIALHILRLTSDPDATARQLADLIERDPSLAAQIMRYARSALFNYQGEINTLQEAVSRVLGFDRVAHIAMGVASSKAFNVPREGLLGLDAFWRHTVSAAYLCQRIAERLPRGAGVDPGQAYLCGLLHNFGLLLIGHLFPPEYRLLNKLREANPEAPLAALEQQVFGQGAQELISVGHGTIGGILLKLWQLPEPIVKSAGLHQQTNYQGECAAYV
ncbi:MAG: HDOD domain-containing protein, partial [Gammaproteobacteria bacterium]|nr:HDOD domain-containing protein [Gammaproteobacteria bacterium]